MNFKANLNYYWEHIIMSENNIMSYKIIDKFVHPITKKRLWKGIDGNLYKEEFFRNIVYKNKEGIYDFVSQNEYGEREHFDNLNEFYKRYDHVIQSVDDFYRLWQNEVGFKELLESMGDISGKKILLLGNGTSLKELYFAWLGAKCVYTDLSLEAVKYVKDIFDQSELKQFDQNIEFHAVDACRLPFPDESFDIIYGCVFVHHISDLDIFLSEVRRCLKTDGICRFLDPAYSPMWQFLKRTLLKPLQLYTHRKYGISPADLNATIRGGI